jgi:hypothetical protein
MNDKCISPLRRRMIEDMTVRKFTLKTQSDYIRVVKAAQPRAREPRRRAKSDHQSNQSKELHDFSWPIA